MPPVRPPQSDAPPGQAWTSWLLILGALIAAGLGLSAFGRGWLLAALRAVRALGGAGALVYGLIYVAGTVLMFPGTILTLGAGLLYGVVVGSFIAIPASLTGAGLAFLIARGLGRQRLERRLTHMPRLAALDRAVARRGSKIVLLLRLEPLILPFAPLNYALGLTAVPLSEYLLASWLGMMPATIFYVWLGSTIPRIAGLMSGPPRGPATIALSAVGIAVGAAVLFWLARFAHRALRMEFESEDGAL